MRFSLRSYQVIAATLLMSFGLDRWPVYAAEEIKSANDFAILIVGDESDAEMLRKEKVLIQEMAKSLKKQNKVAIYSYHFNKERERTYCEKKLNVIKEDLLFIGLVSLKDRVPRKVIYRIDRIVSPARASSDILSRSEDILSGLGSAGDATPTTPSTLAPTNTTALPPTGNKTSDNGRWRIQLGVFTQQKSAQDLIDSLKQKGYEGHLDKVAGEGSTVFKVWVGSFATKEDAQQNNTEMRADGFDKGFVLESK